MFESFLLAFIPLFVAVDPIGALPIFVSLTHQLKREEKKRIIVQSILTALGLALGFLVLGKATFRVLGITIGDFMIAGGAILFCISIMDLVNPGAQKRLPVKELGVVPLGTPLIVGPAVLTTSLILVDSYGLWITMLAVLVNVLLVAAIFWWSNGLIKLLGKDGTRAISKIISLFLAAIAVMLIRRGLVEILSIVQP